MSTLLDTHFVADTDAYRSATTACDMHVDLGVPNRPRLSLVQAEVTCAACKAAMVQQKPIKRTWNVCVVDGHASPISTWFTNATRAEVLRWVKSLSGSLSGRHVTSASFVAIYAPPERTPDVTIDGTIEEMQFITLPAVQERTTVGACWAEMKLLDAATK